MILFFITLILQPFLKRKTSTVFMMIFLMKGWWLLDKVDSTYPEMTKPRKIILSGQIMVRLRVSHIQIGIQGNQTT